MYQYQCDYIKNKDKYIWTFVQKLTLRSSLQDRRICNVVVKRGTLITSTPVRQEP